MRVAFGCSTRPPAELVRRFRSQMLRVANTWTEVDRLLGGRLVLTSWYRDAACNASAGGHPDSQHLTGTAIDATCPGVSQAELYRLASGVAARNGTRALLSERGAVHVQALPVGTVAAIRRSGDRPASLAPAAASAAGALLGLIQRRE